MTELTELKRPSLKLQRKVAEALGWTDLHDVDTWVWGRGPDGSHSFMAPVHVLDAIEVRGWVWTWGTDDAWICTRDYTASRISFAMPRRPNEHREVMLYRVFVEAVKGARK